MLKNHLIDISIKKIQDWKKQLIIDSSLRQ